jgi:hypothetical protein
MALLCRSCPVLETGGDCRGMSWLCGEGFDDGNGSVGCWKVGIVQEEVSMVPMGPRVAGK